MGRALQDLHIAYLKHRGISGANRHRPFDALPTPYGLVRYGVAPDHPRIKSVVDTLAEMLETVEQGAPNTSTAAQNTKPHAENGVTSLHECTSPASNAPAGRIRFFGAVQYGREIDMQDLKSTTILPYLQQVRVVQPPLAQ